MVDKTIYQTQSFPATLFSFSSSQVHSEAPIALLHPHGCHSLSVDLSFGMLSLSLFTSSTIHRSRHSNHRSRRLFFLTLSVIISCWSIIVIVTAHELLELCLFIYVLSHTVSVKKILGKSVRCASFNALNSFNQLAIASELKALTLLIQLLLPVFLFKSLV